MWGKANGGARGQGRRHKQMDGRPPGGDFQRGGQKDGTGVMSSSESARFSRKGGGKDADFHEKEREARNGVSRWGQYTMLKSVVSNR